MAARLCPYCMQMSETDICPHCGKNIHYTGQPMHLPGGYVVTGKYPYVLGAALGQGGFGITYIALNMVTSQRVAIKEYYPVYCSARSSGAAVTAFTNLEEDYLKGKERFLGEARTLKSLSDLPNIVNVLDFFEANNTAYLVMEFLEGSSLKAYAAKNGRFPAQQFLKQLKPLMEDLHRMHDRGVIHRDIAPDNIILLPDGRMKLIDFGAARSYLGDKSMTVMVKKGFAPVEQYLSSGSNPCTDVYALAATIYYCITGTVPADSALRQSEGRPLAAPTSLGADITPDQEKALLMAMELRQKERTQSVQIFLDQLSAKKPQPKPTPEKPKPEKSVEPQTEKPFKPKTSKPKPDNDKNNRKKPALILAAAAVLILALGLFLVTGQSPGFLPAENPTYSEDTWQSNLLDRRFSSPDQEVTKATPVFGSEIPRSEILNVVFLNTLENAPETSWDVSDAQNRSVLAWTVENGTGYDLYLAANGGINAGTSTAGMFEDFQNMQFIQNLNLLHTEYTSDMGRMFDGCFSLTSCDFSGADLGNVSNMYYMFYNCSSLTSCNFSGSNLGNVRSMASMFFDCGNLTSCDFSGSNLENVSDMYCMFYGCSSLITCNFSGTNLGNVSDMSLMFYNCSSLASCDFSGISLNNVNNMYCMFFDCKSMTSCDFSGTNLGNVSNMSQMFSGCHKLTSCDFSETNLGNVSDMSYMFIGCRSLSSCDFSGTNLGFVSNTSYMFSVCDSLTSVRYGDTAYTPEEFEHALLSSSLNPQANGETEHHVKIQDFGSEQRVIADNLEIHVKNERDVTITLSGLSLEDSYVTNLSTSTEGSTEYSWSCQMYGSLVYTESYDVLTTAWANSPGKENKITLDDMQHTLSVLEPRISAGEEQETVDVFVNIAAIKITHTEDSITWLFHVPDAYLFDIHAMTHFKTSVYNKSTGYHMTQTYLVDTGK